VQAHDLRRNKRSRRTLFPTTKVLPLGSQARALATPKFLTSLTQALVLTSQIRAVPSSLTLQSSASFTGLKATLAMAAECPFSSVENRTLGFSGFPKITWSTPSWLRTLQVQHTDSQGLVLCPSRNQCPNRVPSDGAEATSTCH
jgi:hypothetical protein